MTRPSVSILTDALGLHRPHLVGLGLIYLAALSCGMAAAALMSGCPVLGCALAVATCALVAAGTRSWRRGRDL